MGRPKGSKNKPKESEEIAPLKERKERKKKAPRDPGISIGNFLIQWDEHSYMLFEKIISKRKKTGEEYENFRGPFYYGRFEQVCQEILNSAPNIENASGLEEVIRIWTDYMQELKEMLRDKELRPLHKVKLPL